MTWRGLVVWAVVSSATSGCFDFVPSPGPDGGQSRVDAGPPIPVPADPLTATGTLDPTRKATGRFGWDAGGALTVTAADGTVFTLTVPPTSLTETQVITMTPYASLSTGLGEQSFGVKLEPEGLQATTTSMELSITPPTGTQWPVAQQVPFALQGARDVVSLALVDRGSQPVKLLLGHFSSYGVALSMRGVDATLTEARARLGGDVESQLETEVGAVLGKARVQASMGQAPDDLWDQLQPFVHRYVEQVLKPRLAAAKGSCANARLAVQTLLGFERQMLILGGDAQAFFSFDYSTLFDLTTVCMKEEYELCRDEHIITRIIPVFLGTLRQMALLGRAQDSLLDPARFESEQYLSKCLQFSLELTSDVTYTEGSGGDQYVMRERMYLPPNATAQYLMTTDGNPTGLSFIDSTGAMITGVVTDFSVSNFSATYANPCVSVTSLTPGGGQFAMQSVAFRPKEGDLEARAQVDDFFIVPTLIPNTSQHTIVVRAQQAGGCGAGGAPETVLHNWSYQGFYAWFGSLDSMNADSYITDWTIVGGEVMATKQVRWMGTAGENFNADFTLRHIPQPE